MFHPEDENFEEEYGTQEDEDNAPDWVYLSARKLAQEFTLSEARKNARRKKRVGRQWFLLSWFYKKEE